jgi:hypothetical protein
MFFVFNLNLEWHGPLSHSEKSVFFFDCAWREEKNDSKLLGGREIPPLYLWVVRVLEFNGRPYTGDLGYKRGGKKTRRGAAL